MTGMAQVRRTLSDLSSGNLENIQRRGRNNLTPWDLVGLVVAIPAWLSLWWLGTELVWILHLLFHPEPAGLLAQFWSEGLTSVSMAMMFIAPAMPAFGFALMIGNFVTNLIPAARRDLEQKTLEDPNVAYKPAQAGLFVFTLILLAVSSVLAVIGAATLNHLK